MCACETINVPILATVQRLRRHIFIILLGWQQIVCRWIPPRPSCCGPALNATSRCWVVVLLPCSSAQILWQPAIMYEYLGWPFRRIWPLRSLFQRPVQLVSTGCANFVAFGGRLTKNRQQLLCMLSWRHGLIIATLSMQELRRRSQISYNEFSTPPPWHEGVWSWSVETPSWQTALAGCAGESHLQARPHDVPLFARTSTTVPRRSYQASHRSCIAT